jgi:O-acetyl-ADP-ribose deacetylase (regulator of RNase III)
MKVEVIHGDLLDQPVDAIVNTWNQNIIPWWLLLPQGVSGAIKRRAGLKPFQELTKVGFMSLGQAVLTSSGRLTFQGIIHVAGINAFWQASEHSIRQSVRNAVAVAEHHNFKSIAFPIIGAGSGNFNRAKALELMLNELATIDTPVEVKVVQFAN